jgi:eukaryotic-like serine/threonine-protein kinase
MSLPDSTQPDEHYAARLAARDEALARGQETPEDDLPEDLRRRLDGEVPFLKLVQDALSPATPLQALGRFQIRRVLGRGGYGLVYVAFDPRLGRDVALKVPRADALVTPQLRERFYREARAAAVLDHPNIVPVHEAGEVGPVCYITYAYCPGPTLAAWQRSRTEPLPAAQAAAFVATLAEAVSHAHARGVVHRDLKPANILLWFDREAPASAGVAPAGASRFNEFIPKITDFGLARRADEAGHTATGEVLGTPAYMAPEQAAGRGKEAGPGADVYALGVILYELLTGRPPFQTETALETLRLVIEEEPVPPRRLNPLAPRDLETICLKCLEKEPRRRYPSAQDLADDLRRHLAGRPIATRPVGAVERAWLWARRRPTAAALAVVSGLAALALVGVVTGIVYSRRLKEALDQTEQARGAEARARHDEQRASYYHRITLANGAWREGNVRKAVLMLRECPEEQRGWEWLYLRRLCFPELRLLHSPLEDWTWSTALVFSPDGRQLAAFVSPNTIKLWDVADGRELLSLNPTMGAIWSLAFNPDGTRLAAAGEDATVRVFDARSGEPLLPLNGHTKQVTSVTYSPDGNLLATAAFDGTARIWEARTGSLLRRFATNPANTKASVAFSADGRWLAEAGDAAPEVHIWDVVEGTKQTLRGLSDSAYSRVVFSPDGRRLAVAGLDRMVMIWDWQTGQTLLQFGPHEEIAWDVAFSSDGRFLAVGCNSGPIKLWDLADRREIATLRGHAGNVTSVAFEPGGVRLASAGAFGSVRLWDVTALPEPTVFRGHVENVRCVVFHPDGTRLATAGKDGTVRVWDVATGEELLTLWVHRETAGGVAFSPDGRRLASSDLADGIRVWDPGTGRPVFTVVPPGKETRSLVYSPDGRALASADTDGVHLWDAGHGGLLFSLRGHEGRINAITFSPDGCRLASAGFDHTVRIWDIATHREEHCLRTHGAEVHGVSFSPDGRRLATASGDESLCLFDTASGELVWRSFGHTSGVNAVAFCPDGRRVATASFDRTVRIWDAETGEELLALTGHTGGCLRLAFSPDGTRLVSTARDGTARLWDARPVRPEDGVEREALALVRRLVPTSKSLAEVRQRLEADTRIGEAVRRQALDYADTVWPARVRQRASRYVENRFAESMRLAQVREAVRSDAGLGDEERQAALEVLDRWPRASGD